MSTVSRLIPVSPPSWVKSKLKLLLNWKRLQWAAWEREPNSSLPQEDLSLHKVASPSLDGSSLISPQNRWILGFLHCWICEDGTWRNLNNTGSEGRWRRLMDDSALFCLESRALPSTTSDVPGCALACRVPLVFNYRSVGITLTCMFAHNVCSSWVLMCCIMTASALGRSHVHLILTATIADCDNGVCLNSSIFSLSFSPPRRNRQFLQGTHITQVVAICW